MKPEDLVRPGDTIFDIGANIGDIAEPLTRAAPHGRVFAFEPAPKVFSLLQNRLRGYHGALALQLAVGDRPGHSQVFHHYDWTLLNGDDPRRATNVYHSGSYPHLKQPEPFEIEVVTLDQLIRIFGRPSFIKIDVDGWEARVVRGMTHFLGSLGPGDPALANRPRILMEIGAYTLAKLGDTIEDVTEPLLRTGFWAFHSIAGERLSDTAAIAAACPENGTVDVLFK